jgi:hypothetical protein
LQLLTLLGLDNRALRRIEPDPSSQSHQVNVGLSSRILGAMSKLVTGDAADHHFVIAKGTCNC